MVIQVLNRWVSKHFYVILTLLVISCLQALMLIYGEFGWNAITATQNPFLGDKAPVSNTLIFDYLRQLGFLRVSGSFANKAIVFFIIQSIPVFIYSYCQPTKSKRIVSLLIWLSPILLLELLFHPDGIQYVPSILISALFYLLTSLYPIEFLSALASDTFDKRTFYKGIFFPLAAIGCFNLFWLGVVIKSWLFPRHGSKRVG